MVAVDSAGVGGSGILVRFAHRGFHFSPVVVSCVLEGMNLRIFLTRETLNILLGLIAIRETARARRSRIRRTVLPRPFRRQLPVRMSDLRRSFELVVDKMVIYAKAGAALRPGLVVLQAFLAVFCLHVFHGTCPEILIHIRA